MLRIDVRIAGVRKLLPDLTQKDIFTSALYRCAGRIPTLVVKTTNEDGQLRAKLCDLFCREPVTQRVKYRP
jgi:hypothetical protein